ncbi:hypothetical protein H4V97_000270 [Flavobacterium sp. CG_23.5]|uniref:helix-turn-helix domain-containing protein n=1 Tax=Flavobacterium sp. CG_23.5 TaxID=2760708 RepID=UPI001AE95646|nr:helix-turn-helix domain-containing protein [Flavobacterium sp. CG_23.5]MBP2281952.1 hypothetical protein [Flavobacterium sp. CG_23.5]
MSDQIILQGTTSEALVNLISEGVKIQLDKFKKELANPDPDILLTRDEACELLKINSSTLWHWTNKGKVIAYGIVNRRYYKRAELLAAIKPLKV